MRHLPGVCAGAERRRKRRRRRRSGGATQGLVLLPTGPDRSKVIILNLSNFRETELRTHALAATSAGTIADFCSKKPIVFIHFTGNQTVREFECTQCPCCNKCWNIANIFIYVLLSLSRLFFRPMSSKAVDRDRGEGNVCPSTVAGMDYIRNPR